MIHDCITSYRQYLLLTFPLSLPPLPAFRAAIVKSKAVGSAFVQIWEAVGLCSPRKLWLWIQKLSSQISYPYNNHGCICICNST